MRMILIGVTFNNLKGVDIYRFEAIEENGAHTGNFVELEAEPSREAFRPNRQYEVTVTASQSDADETYPDDEQEAISSGPSARRPVPRR
jgi:hypothetical protein